MVFPIICQRFYAIHSSKNEQFLISILNILLPLPPSAQAPLPSSYDLANPILNQYCDTLLFSPTTFEDKTHQYTALFRASHN